MRPTLSVLFLLSATLSALPAAAQVELNPSHPQTYKVRSGDTLWGIAGQFLRDPWRWPEVWEANREVGNPNLIYPGDTLSLHYRNGQPRVGVRRGTHTVKLSPRVRATPLKEPVPAIPLGSILPFLTRPYVLDKAEIERAPYVVGFPREHIVAGLGDAVYVRGIEGVAGDRYAIVRPGQPYRDPDRGDILGYQARFVADVVLDRPGDPAKATIAGMELETAIGDRVLPARGDDALANFLPHPGPHGLRGRIIAVLGGVTQIGQFDVVVLDMGSRDGLKEGQVFDVFSGGGEARDLGRSAAGGWDWEGRKFWSQEFWYGEARVRGWLIDELDPNTPLPPHVDVRKDADTYIRPFEQAGTLMVFRPFEQVSFALIMRATRAMHVLDAVRAPRI